MEATKAAGREPAKSTLVATAWISAVVCWQYGQGVILVGVILVGVILVGVILVGVILVGLILLRVILVGVILVGVILVGVILVGLIIHIYYLGIARWVSQTRELTLGISLVVSGAESQEANGRSHPALGRSR